MATSKNYGKKKVRITSGIFWTLMAKNPIMEKSDAGAAGLSWTFFSNNSVGDHMYVACIHIHIHAIFIYIHSYIIYANRRICTCERVCVCVYVPQKKCQNIWGAVQTRSQLTAISLCNALNIFGTQALVTLRKTQTCMQCISNFWQQHLVPSPSTQPLFESIALTSLPKFQLEQSKSPPSNRSLQDPSLPHWRGTFH